MRERKAEKIVLEEIRRDGEKLCIPKSLEPERMEESLKEHERKRFFLRGRLYPALAGAACVCLIGGALLRMERLGLLAPAREEAPGISAADMEAVISRWEAWPEEERELLGSPEKTYEEIYERLSQSWQELSMGADEADRYDVAETEMKAEASFVRKDSVRENSRKEAFGKTNVQVETVAEADRIQNDGRYLYQVVQRQKSMKEEVWGTGIQILDTKDGLRETAYLDGFESVKEFYVWENLLITIEDKYYDSAGAVPLQDKGKEAVYDLAYMPEQYHEIRIYDIRDREKPEKLKTFTLQGGSESSRISEGYFYGISHFTAAPGEGEEDYDAYIPTLDGKRMEAGKIYCPPEQTGDSFLVLVSIDLQNPYEFVDTRAVLMGNGTYYVSERNIYLASYRSVYENPAPREGKTADWTELLRFSYLKGRFYGQARGEVPGRLDSSFSMDEYEGNLRLVTTVQEYEAKKVTDDRTGEELGYDYGQVKESNGLYILGKNLVLKGKIEGLAENESIYSARFLGDTGYFVTFRRTDPLFAVDLSNPEQPKVLGELKVSGFSDYLHGYGENRLLGIGMEADEDTGQQQGMKLSMFDLADPADVKEEARFRLENYNYSEVLYNHREVLIDVEENLIGFSTDGSDNGNYWRRYLVFSYENGAFVKKMELDMEGEDGGYMRMRATFIGDTLYLLCEDGHVRAYSRQSGALLEEL